MKLYIKNMVSQRCKIVVGGILQKMGVNEAIIDCGVVEIPVDLTFAQYKEFGKNLLNCGLELLDDKKQIFIERIIGIITEMVQGLSELPVINYSTYISNKMNYDYTYLSNLFSEAKGITIQQFIIIHKIEKVKELLVYDELNLSEISYKLNYSSVAHLSNQFKKTTGLAPKLFKQLKQHRFRMLQAAV